MKIWRMLAVLCMIGALVFSFAACVAAPTETTAEPTETTVDPTAETEPLVDSETFKAFIGTWYADGSSVSYQIKIDKNASWNFIDNAGNILYTGIVVVLEDNVSISLCDPDSVQMMDLKLEEDGKMSVEFYAEGLMSLPISNVFLNTVTNSVAIETPITGEEESTNPDIPAEETPTTDTTPVEELEDVS